MATLWDYQKQTQRALRDAKQDMLNPEDLVTYINRARREVAMRAQCIRILPATSGSIVSWTVTNQGSGYSSSPTLTITAPDYPSGALPNPNGAQATAGAIVSGGKITAINSTYGGAGYFQPLMTITDTTGTGATATAVMSPMNLLNIGQEQYSFSDIDLSVFPGVKEIYYVRSASVIFSNYRFSLIYQPFSVYQAYVRQYPSQYRYCPSMYSQFGQGASGTLFFYPIPSQSYQLELDCLCIPSDLVDNQSVEILPDPWTDAVPYFAAALCYEELQNLNSANYFHTQFEKRLLNYSNYARVGRAPNIYGRP